MVENQRYEPPRGHLRGRFNARSRTATSLSPRQNSQRPFSTELSRSKPKHGESRRRTWRIRIENQPKRVPHAHRLGAMSGTPEHFLKLSSDKESSPYPCMISQLRDLSPMVKKKKKNEPARLNLSRVRTNFNWRPITLSMRTPRAVRFTLAQGHRLFYSKTDSASAYRLKRRDELRQDIEVMG